MLQKKIIRIVTGAKCRKLCKSILENLKFYLFRCEYGFSLMNFITNKLDHFRTNPAV
jgi:hypothetical protein